MPILPDTPARLVLGLETSCDETAVGLYGGRPPRLLGHLLSSQAELHALYGGVVPELAARDHQRQLLPLVDRLLEQTGTDGQQLDAVACTAGPGLIGALKTGLALASGLAMGWQVPMLPIHHLEAHLLSVLLERELDFPWLTLLISGGHTQLVQVQGLGQYQLLGQSRDDAVGEAFDKVAKMLELPYPGGPALEKLAAKGDPKAFDFPRPMTGPNSGADFSFSGLKTAVLYCLQEAVGGQWRPGRPVPQELAADVAASFQRAVSDTLAHKVAASLRTTKLGQLIAAGGVAANAEIRTSLRQATEGQGAEAFFPDPTLCTDNGAMIALTGWLRLAGGDSGELQIAPRSRWPLDQMHPPGAGA